MVKFYPGIYPSITADTIKKLLDMLELQILRNQTQRVLDGLRKRGWTQDQLAVIQYVIDRDDQRKNSQEALDLLRNLRKKESEEINKLIKEGKSTEANELKIKVQGYKADIAELENELEVIESQILEKLTQIPNIPHLSVPHGKDPSDNEEVRKSDQPPVVFNGNWAKPHWDLAKQYGLIDFDLGTFLTGSGFPLFRGKGAQLVRGLINFFLEEARNAGYEEVMPPLMVNYDSAFGTGQLPDKEGQMYVTKEESFYLIPTAEVPLTNMYRDKIIEREKLPIRLTGHTPCFRREAGSYGSDVKGLNRVHQFDKVEIVQICKPEDSYPILEDMVNHVASLLDKLELHYRVIRLCGGDMGFNSALTYDFEVLSSAQMKWLEVSSVSNFETYQTNRMKIRYKDIGGATRLLHTLNGSALALPRIVAALLENNQTENGIHLPDVLKPYTGFDWIN